MMNEIESNFSGQFIGIPEPKCPGATLDCRKDIYERMGGLVTKKSLWIACCVIIIPILVVGLRVWGQTEFFTTEQVKINTKRIDSLEDRAIKIETEFGHLKNSVNELKTQQYEDTKQILRGIEAINKNLIEHDRKK